MRKQLKFAFRADGFYHWIRTDTSNPYDRLYLYPVDRFWNGK